MSYTQSQRNSISSISRMSGDSNHSHHNSIDGSSMAPFAHPTFDTSSVSPTEQRRVSLHRRFTSETMTTPPRDSTIRLGPTSREHSVADLEDQRFEEFARKTQEQKEVQDAIERLTLKSQQNMAEMMLMHQDMQNDPLGKALTSAPFIDPATPPENNMFMDRVRPGMNGGVLLETPPQSKNYDSQQLQLMTPPADELLALSQGNSAASGNSRRNSGENDKKYGYDQGTPTPATGHSRTMSVTRDSYGRGSNTSTTKALGNGMGGFLNHQNRQGQNFSFGNDINEQGAQTQDPKSFHLQVNATEENFPILVRRDSYPAAGTGMDHAFTQGGLQSTTQTAWPSFSRHSRAQQSLPSNTFSGLTGTMSQTPMMPLPDLGGLRLYDQQAASFGNMTDGLSSAAVAPARLQSSYSTSDLPTMRSFADTVRPALDCHQRQASYDFQSAAAAAGAYGPLAMGTGRQSTAMSPMPALGAYGQYYQPPGTATPVYQQPGYAYATAPGQFKQEYAGANLTVGRGHQKRNSEAEGAKFAHVSLESVANDIYVLCKDQHGCRFLQKKLEEKNPRYVQMIFDKTKNYVVELMTDPFGNYLCQKLLEFTNDEQRTVLVNNASPSLVDIALNQHGTRALQKMIEFISTPEQIHTVMEALKSKVVQLIQDLNGNHVIQKCLNRLAPPDAQFIYDAVGANCIQVGTHRHGCCVLQRCIDHASETQKIQLIGQVTEHAFALVQDAYGNYVVQYILDLGDTRLSDTLIRQFLGNVRQLSKEKFSSNVIEKCIRVAEEATKTAMIEELMADSNELDRLVRDNYANYVIQTALEYGEEHSRDKLIEAIKPILPAIRMTPYGRRIISKIQGNTGLVPQAGAYAYLGAPGVPGDNVLYRNPTGTPGQEAPRSFVAQGSYVPPVTLQYPVMQNAGAYRPPYTTGVGSPNPTYY